MSKKDFVPADAFLNLSIDGDKLDNVTCALRFADSKAAESIRKIIEIDPTYTFTLTGTVFVPGDTRETALDKILAKLKK